MLEGDEDARLSTQAGGPVVWTLDASQLWLERVSRLKHQLSAAFGWTSLIGGVCGLREIACNLLETEPEGRVLEAAFWASAEDYREIALAVKSCITGPVQTSMPM